MTILSRLRKRPTTPVFARDGWHKRVEVNNALTCCQHCRGCHWENMHPAPCRDCVRELQASPPLAGCLADAQGRCVTCAALHGVRITHGGAA